MTQVKRHLSQFIIFHLNQWILWPRSFIVSRKASTTLIATKRIVCDQCLGQPYQAMMTMPARTDMRRYTTTQAIISSPMRIQ